MSEPTNEELAATFESYVGRISGYPHGWNTLAGLLKIAASRLRSLSPQAEFPAPAAPASGEDGRLRWEIRRAMSPLFTFVPYTYDPTVVVERVFGILKPKYNPRLFDYQYENPATIATLTAENTSLRSENERLRFFADWLAERLETANRCASGDHYDESKSEAALAEYAAFTQRQRSDK